MQHYKKHLNFQAVSIVEVFTQSFDKKLFRINTVCPKAPGWEVACWRHMAQNGKLDFCEHGNEL